MLGGRKVTKFDNWKLEIFEIITSSLIKHNEFNWVKFPLTPKKNPLKNSTTNVRWADSIAGIAAACMLSMAAADYEMCDTAATHPALRAGPVEHMGTVGDLSPFSPRVLGDTFCHHDIIYVTRQQPRGAGLMDFSKINPFPQGFLLDILSRW